MSQTHVPGSDRGDPGATPTAVPETPPPREQGDQEFFYRSHGLRILHSLRRIIRFVGLHSRRLAAEHQITGPQLICLTTILMEGPLTLGGVADRVSLSPSTVNGIVDRLEAKGLVLRVRDRRDRRRVLLTATGAGADRAASAPLPLPARFARRLRGIPEPEQAAIAASLERVVELMDLEDLDEIAAPELPAAPAAPSGEE